MVGFDSKELLELLEAAVMDTFVCGGCGTPLESDCNVCGLCGWENPLSSII